jgi:pimeloyl-ACP methyl ester carboxylesterase
MPREDVWFTSGGERCAAWWYSPEDGGNGRAVVMANGFSLTRHDGLPRFADRFAEAGYSVLLFDHRFLGDSGGEPRQRFRIAAQEEDWRNAFAFAQAREGAENGVIVWGYSFAGAHATRIASERGDVAALLLLCPFADGLKRVLKTSPALSAWVIPRAMMDVAGRHNLIPVTAQPGEHAAMTFPGEADGFAETVAAGSPWRNEISPGVFAVVGMHRPVRWAKRIGCPAFVALGERDVTVDAAAVGKLAKRAPRGELHRYPYDHFELFAPDATDLIAADQVDFLARNGLS